MIERKCVLLRKYLDVTRQMIDVLEELDSEQELTLLFNERDGIIGQIDRIDNKLGEIAKNAEIIELLEQIKESDAHFRQKLTILRDEASDQLQTIKQAQGIRNRYNLEYDAYEAIFYDKKQ